MIIYFADRRMNILGLASTELMEGFTVEDDLKTVETDTGVATFECTIPWSDDTRANVEACTAAGNYLLRSDNGDNEFYTIIEAENDTKKQAVDIYAEDAGMDLLNETVGAYEATEAHPAAWYVEKYSEDTGFEIGINEISDLTRTLKWEGEATAAERIASVATEFDNAEISYSFDIEGLTVTHKYINIHKKRGKDAGYQLRLNRDVDKIVTTTSVADLATALYVTGGTPEAEGDEEPEPISLKGYNYDDGDIYVMEGTPILCKRSALTEWSRYVWAKEPNQIEGYTGNIIKQWSYDTTSQSELCNRAITQLNKVSEPAVNYEIDITTLPENVGIGDYVDIVDEKGELYLSSRILKLTTSRCNQKQTATLGEFLIKESGIAETVRELAEQFSQLAKTRQFYTWIAYADDEYGDGISLDPAGKIYMGTATNMTSAEVDISDPSVFKWSLIQGEGVGIEEMITWYGVSDSPETVPDEWSQEPYEVLRNEYQWSYVETIYTNGVVEMTTPHIIAYYDYLEVDELTASVANIEYLLAGNVGTGTLDAIHLTTDNAVIDEGVIIQALIDTAIIGDLLAGSINTDVITIYSESGGYITQGATTQYYDSDGNIRIQIGQDESGNFTFILYDETGEGILIDQDGIKASAISDGLIVNDMVADDAAISGWKLDIQSVAECLTEDGSLVLDASNILINDTTLDYYLGEIVDTVYNLSLDGVKDFTMYFALWHSATEPPLDPDEVVPALTDVALTDYSFTDVYDSGDFWTEDQPQPGAGQYLWARYYVEYEDGHFEWSKPFCLTDDYIRETTTVLQTELQVVQGNISAIISSSQIDELLDGGYTLYDLYSSINMSVDEISTTVGSNTLRVESLEENVDSQSTALDELQDTVTIQYESMQSTIQQLADSITFTISGAVQSITETTDGLQSQLDEYATYFQFAQEGLEIGELNSPFKVLLGPTKLSFMDEDTEMAYFSNSMLFINDAEILNTLRIGNFRWQPGANGNLNLIKVSEEE